LEVGRITDFVLQKAFTLIELSIVMVIIGLLLGGVLVGQDLIRAAEVRAQISQIEKYNTAVNTFRGKYGAIPGDMNVVAASQFGFANAGCTGTAGQRDGNGLVDGNGGAGSLLQGGGETGLFWGDMSNVGLTQYVDGTFNAATCTSTPSPQATQINLYVPAAKVGSSNYVYVYETNSINYYGLSNASAFTTGYLTTGPAISAQQAYAIDQKMDDGLPASGNVQAVYVAGTVTVSGPPNHRTYTPSAAVSPAANASPAVQGDCYDSTSTAGAYALTVNGNSQVVCSLSFAFQ
jgi:prepilin-type N-terminal cleavage/methylation domain-containing protein